MGWAGLTGLCCQGFAWLGLLASRSHSLVFEDLWPLLELPFWVYGYVPDRILHAGIPLPRLLSPTLAVTEGCAAKELLKDEAFIVCLGTLTYGSAAILAGWMRVGRVLQRRAVLVAAALSFVPTYAYWCGEIAQLRQAWPAGARALYGLGSGLTCIQDFILGWIGLGRAYSLVALGHSAWVFIEGSVALTATTFVLVLGVLVGLRWLHSRWRHRGERGRWPHP